MKEDLFPYYEGELRFVREMAKEFALDHPGAADRLLIEGDRCADPHVERLIQAFALIAGRIRHKLDDEFPEITEALLGILYPHYVRPIPSMAIAQFELDPTQGKSSAGTVIPRHATLFTRPIARAGPQGASEVCRFRTAYPVTLWPMKVTAAQVLPPAALSGTIRTDEAVAAIRISFECQGDTTPSSMGLDRLRFHLHGEGEVPYMLYELIANSTTDILLTAAGPDDTLYGPYRFPAGALSPAGFERNEALLPYPDRSFAGYGLLTEYFAFPDKFLFFDLAGFDKMPLAHVGARFEVTLLIGEFERKEWLRRLEKLVRADNFQLGCTPMVNLFERPARPIAITHTETEYHVAPDQHNPHSFEVYSVDKVVSYASWMEQAREYQPFYGLRHDYDDNTPKQFWYASRRRSPRRDNPGTEVYLSLVDLEFRPSRPASEALSVHVTCTNRDLPAKLPLAQEFGELTVDAGASIRARCLRRPTECLRPPLRSGLQWRLISHLALNYLSLAEGETLRQILGLYNYADHPAVRNQITGVLKVSNEPHMTRMLTSAGVTFALGMRVKIEFDEERFAGSGVFLMASVLERFLGLYSSINSFTQLTASTRQRKGPLRTWLPRAGEQILV